MIYTRKQVLMAFLAGCLLLDTFSSVRNGLFDLITGTGSPWDYLVLGLHVATLLLALWLLRRAFTAGMQLSRGQV